MDEEDTYQTLAGQVLDPIIEQGKRVIDWSGRVFEGRSQELQGVPAAQRNEEVRPIGTPAVLNGQPVKWAGQNYGWQSETSFNQLEEEGEFRFGEITGQRIMGDITQGVGQVIESIPEPIKQTAVDVAKAGVTQAAEAYYSLPLYQQQQLAAGVQFVGGGVKFAGGVMEEVSRMTNTSRFITDELVTLGTGKALKAGFTAAKPAVTQAVKTAVKAADDLIPPGASPRLATAMAGAAPMQPMAVSPSFERGGLVMKAVTSQHTEALELTGRKTGEEIVGADVAIGKQLTKRKKDIQSVESDIKYYKEALEGLDELKGDPRNLRAFVGEDPDLSRLWNRYVEKYGPDKVFAKVRSKYAEQKAAADTMWSRIKSNVLPFEKEGDYSKWYASSAAKPFKQKAEKILRARGELQIKEYLQQHHLIPKGMTAAYFDKMDQLIASGKAKLDDLVLMAEVAAAKGKPTGDVKVNIEDMIPKPHNEMHMVLRSQGAEVAKSKLIKDLSKVNTVDELMEKWVREFDPDGNFTYNYETAKVWEGLDKLLKELRGS